jgi:Xaa-Pro dipeptidase
MAATELSVMLVMQNADLFYFTGTVQDGILVLPQEGEPFYLVRKSRERAKAESLLENILSFRTFRELPEIFKSQGLAVKGKWGLELDVLPANFYLRLQSALNHNHWEDASPLIRATRAVKSEYELGFMREAANISHRIATFAAECLQAGMTELEWATAIQGEALRAGHQGLVNMRRWNQVIFFGHVLSGDSSTVPSYVDSPTGGRGPNAYVGNGAGWRKIGRCEPLSVDMVGAWGGYMVDQARMYSLGELSPEIKAAYKVVLEIEKEIASRLKPGAMSSQLYAAALEMARESGYGEYFMNFGENQVSFVGHGIGIEMDEYPFIAKDFDMPLEAGMTVALEPKIIFPQKGMAGIEDTFVVTPAGGEQLNITPKEIFEL